MKTQMIEWSDIPFILAVCKTGSLSAAARELGVNHSTVFRRLERVEEKLGVRLFERLNNGYVMTPAGELFYRNASGLHEGLNDIERELSGQDLRLEGTLTVTTTDSIAYCLSSVFCAFQEKYPEIQLRVVVDPRQLDLMQREADIAIRPTIKPPEHWLGRNLTSISFAPYAHKSYMDKMQSMGEGQYRWIGLDIELRHSPMTKILDACRHPDTPLTVTSTLMTAFELAQNGLGIAVLPCYLATKNEDLVQVIKADPKFNWDIWLLSHPDLRRSARVHAFFRFAADEIASVLKSHPPVT